MKIILFLGDNEQHVITIFGTSGTFGTAHDNTVVLDDPGIAEYHACIQYIEGKWMLCDLAGRNDVLLNDQNITEEHVSERDILFIGNVKIMVVSLVIDHEEHVHVSVPATVAETHIAELPKTVQCPGCGMVLSALVQYCPRCGSALYGITEYSEQQYRTPVSFILARIALICAVCGPLLLGIGWLLGLIFGFTVIVRSRRISAVKYDLKMAWKAIGISICWVMLMGAGIGWYSYSSYTRNEIADNEMKVRKLLSQLAVAEYYVKYAEVYDSDKDTIGEYVNVPLLQQSGYHAFDKNLVLNDTYEGYRIILQQADENEFVCQAVPLQYGITGRKTFWIDSKGRIYNMDRSGNRFETPPDASIDHDRLSVIHIVGDELADDLYQAAKEALLKKNYLGCARITKTIRQVFPQSPASLRLNPLEKSTEPFLIEYKAGKLFDDAQEKIHSGHDDAALITMRDLVSLFPRSTRAVMAEVYIIEIAERCATRDIARAKELREERSLDKAIATLNNVYVKYPEASADTVLTNLIADYIDQNKRIREEDANTLLAKARKLEAGGDYASTLPLLLSVKNRFADTQAAKGIDASIQQTGSALNEMDADDLIQQLLQQSSISNAPVILSEIVLLKTKYINTEPYIEHSNMLVKLEQQCQAYVYIDIARQQFSTQNFLAAKINYELAVKADQIIGDTVRSEMGNCYLALGEEEFSTQDYSTAFECYQKYLNLDSNNVLPDEEKLVDCYYHLSKNMLQNKQYADAERFLLASAEKYKDTPEYNFLYGKVLMHLARWKDAFSRFCTVVKTAPELSENTKLFATFCNYNIARKEERELYEMISEIVLYTECIKMYDINLPVVNNRQSTNTHQIPNVIGKITKTLGDIVVDYKNIEGAHGDGKNQHRAKLRKDFQTLQSQCVESGIVIKDEDERKNNVVRQLDLLFYRLQAVRDTIRNMSIGTGKDEYIEFFNALTKKLKALKQARAELAPIIKKQAIQSQTGVSIIRELSNVAKPEAIMINEYEKYIEELRYAFEFYKVPKEFEPFFKKLSDVYTCVPVLKNETLPEIADDK